MSLILERKKATPTSTKKVHARRLEKLMNKSKDPQSYFKPDKLTLEKLTYVHQ